MRIRNFFENFIILAIILSIIQIFLDEYSRYAYWSVLARNIIIFAGLFFDLLFSVEFIVRVIHAIKKKAVSGYWKYERGWIDFLSSFPLLLLDWPSAYLLLSGNLQEEVTVIAFYNVIKFISEIRITRILRFLRIIKLFGKIKNSVSPMARHHIATISTVTVFTITCTLVFFSILSPPLDHKILERRQFFDESISTIKYLESKSGIPYKDIIKKIFSNEKNLLKLTYKGDIILSRISDEKFKEYYAYGDYGFINNRGFILYFSVIDINREVAYWNIINLVMIIFIILAIMLFYTRHFTQTISNVINSINKGFRTRQYNERVKIRDEYEEDEVFKLAKFYNDAYLPAKLKRINKESENQPAGLQ